MTIAGLGGGYKAGATFSMKFFPGIGGGLCEVDVGQASYNHSNVNDYNKYEYTINFNPVTVIAVYQTAKFDTTLTANAMSDVNVSGTISMEYMI